MKVPRFKPYIAAATRVPEFSFRAVTLGLLLGLLFAIANTYLGLKVGITVTASIPAAVLSLGILKLVFKHVSILEHNLVQTIASVGEGLAAGVIFTVPALFLLGEAPSAMRIFFLSALGGILGVLFMIPMRRYIIVQEHGKLPFPEGTACAEILRAGENAHGSAPIAIIGIITGALYKIMGGVLHLWNEVPTYIIKPFQRTQFSMDCTPALLGVGFIIGPRIASVLFAGGVLAWGVFIPLIKLFGAGSVTIFPSVIPISEMTATDIWSKYVRYIGAGTVATGGLFSLFKIAPLIGKTLKVGFSELFQSATDSKHILRTDRDISLRWLILGSIAIILTLWLFPGLPMNLLTILLLIFLGFFFVAVTSLTVGIVGSTSNPVSGMTITTLLITCLVFVALGWTERIFLIAALTMSVVVNVAIALAGTTSQDLKTGFLLGATPRTQQISEIIGVILPAAFIGGTLYLLSKVYGFGTPELPAPQGTMMAMVAQGVISGNIPFTLVGIGVLIGLLLELVRLPILPFAIGLYLPFSLSAGIMAGGITSFAVEHLSKGGNKASAAKDRGILAASGLVAGDACMGVVTALLAILGWVNTDALPLLPDSFSLILYGLLAAAFAWFSLKPKQFGLKNT
ncbi:MAG: oligopeptide transporter, OPT family [Chlamydiales bacterium]|nr:oligopeptide transporter, OPT family [Chlamydiales bacterium]